MRDSLNIRMTEQNYVTTMSHKSVQEKLKNICTDLDCLLDQVRTLKVVPKFDTETL